MHTADHPLDRCWYAVACSDRIADAPVAIELRKTAYAVWRDTDARIVATLDRCSHRQGRLSSGTVESGCVRCPYHGWKFNASGRCIDIPSSGAGAVIPPAADLDTVHVQERYGLVWLCPGEPADGIPHLDVDNDDAFTRLNTGMQVWNCSATRMVDNMLDVAHFPYTHSGTFGREQEQVVPHFTLEQLDHSFHGYRYSVVVDNEGDAKAMSGGGDDVIGITMTTGFALPFSVRSTMSYDNGIEQTLFMTASPIDIDRSLYTFVLWRNDDVTDTGRQIVDFELEVAREDQTMLERIPGELPLDRGALVDVQSDKASLEWRRRYRALVRPGQGG